MSGEEYKKIIIKMVQELNNEDFLMKIYYFVKVNYDKESRSLGGD